MYHTIIAANPLVRRTRSNGMHNSKKQKLTLLSFQLRLLNFRENMGISDTNNQENKPTATNKNSGWQAEVIQVCNPTATEPQNIALAGTGSPMKEVVWRVSLLNFANRSAENTEIKKAV